MERNQQLGDCDWIAKLLFSFDSPWESETILSEEGNNDQELRACRH